MHPDGGDSIHEVCYETIDADVAWLIGDKKVVAIVREGGLPP